MVTKKVLITGRSGVGKTSLYHRFITGTHQEKFSNAVGVNVNFRELTIKGVNLTLIFWDLAGDIGVKEVPRSYFRKAHLILYVFDLTRINILEKIRIDLEYLNQVMPGIAIQLIGNKVDLVEPNRIDWANDNLTNNWEASAKTGENIDTLLFKIGNDLLEWHKSLKM